MTPPRPARSARGTARGGISAVWFAVGAATAVVGLFGTVAADSRWLAALGAYISDHGIPNFVPYASAPSHSWPNVPVLAELAFHALDAAGGDRALLAAQVTAVAAAFSLLALDLRRARVAGAGGMVVLLLLIPGALASLVPIRSQLFSLALFPLLILLVRREAGSPSRRVWLLVPLLALWSNLHGAVLVGLAVAAAYLVCERARSEPLLAAGVLAASALALFATPATWRTGRYYSDVLDNEAARRGIGLWAPLSLRSGLDLILVICALALAAAALRARPRLWELVALGGLAVLTIHTARGGVWFLFFAATPAALGLGAGVDNRARLALPGAALMLVVAVAGVVRGPHESSAHRALVAQALAEAGGTPILATDQLGEQVALAGGRIWIGNPLDAFSHRDQGIYLDWLQGRAAGDVALAHAPRVVLARPGSNAEQRLVRRGLLREVARDAGGVLYLKRITTRPAPGASGVTAVRRSTAR